MSTSRTFAFTAVIAMIVVMAVPAASSTLPSASAQRLQSPYSLALNPTQDAWVDQGKPTANYGSDPELHVGQVAAPRENPINRQSLLWFDLATLPPGATVLTATLRLYQVQASGATQYSVWPDANWATWDESTVNWSNKPNAWPVGDPPVVLDSADGWKAWEISSMVGNWAIAQIENFGVLLRGDGDTLGLRVFASREDSKYPPMLVIEYSLPTQCTEILSPSSIPSPGLINFDDLSNGTVIGSSYLASRGVTFENSSTTRAIIYGNEPAKAKSAPNVASNDSISPTTSANVPMRIFFDSTKTHVGFWMGNGETLGPTGALTAYDASGLAICTVRNTPVPEPHTEFIGVYDSYGRIASVALDYGNTLLSESIDDLYFAPATGEAVEPVVSNIRPTDWVTTTKNPSAYASAIDVGSGISVTSASYRYSKDGGTTWLGPFPASVSGSNGVTTSQTMTATNVSFGQDSDSKNLIEFRIADMNGNVGTAQGTIYIDTTPPTLPTSFTSSSHTAYDWSNDNTVALSWSGAADLTSGVSGYSVLLDQAMNTLPDAVVDTYGTSYTSPALADANNWYAHVRVRDVVGHWSAGARHLGPFRIDTVAPSNPTTVSSSSHSPSVWSTDTTIYMAWSGASDGASGLNGYSFVWDTSPGTLPDTIADTSGTNTTSSSLSSGNNKYFHIRTVDVAGNWSATAVQRGPYYVDTIAPSSSASSPATSSSASFTVSWAGSDAHSGVGSYDVQYRNMTTGGSWTTWKSSVTTTSGTFSGLNGHIYQFRSRARDNVGNLESYPGGYDSQTSVANIDVWAKSPGLEVNQAIQDLSNSVTLIAGKRTFVRAYVQSDAGDIGAMPAKLKVYRGASLMGTLSPSNSGGTITVRSSPTRGTLGHSYYFDVPVAWLSAGSVTFNFEINPLPRKFAENDYTNNTRSVTVSFVNSPVMNLLIVDVPYKDGGVVRHIRNADYTLLESWLRRAFPIKTLNVWWAYLDPPYNSLPSASTVNGDLAWNKARAVLYDGEDPWMRYYGMAIDTGGFMRGLAAGIPSTVASGPTGPAGGWDTDASYGDWYGGHELGHTYGRSHVLCRGDEAGADSSYPYSNGDISPTQSQWASNALYGLDASGPTVIPPSWKDVMTYCDNEWVSDYTYEGIYNRMKAEKPVSAAQIREMMVAGGEHLAIFGSIITPTDEIKLNAFYRVPNGFDIFERDVNGDYHIRLLDASEATLADYPFSPRFSSSSDEPVGAINELVPWVTDTAKVSILHGETPLITRNVSANAPTVTITYPDGGETLSGSSVTVTWTASDIDGDTLTYSLDYSRDGGTTWEPLSANITETQATLDLTRLPGSAQGRFRVWATDGVNTATDISNADFTVTSKTPAITSIAPTAGQSFVVSQTVAFEGQAFDAEDGLLSDDKLEWRSNLQGTLGTGQLFNTADLAPGTHTITLKATDSNSNVTEATTTIVVTEETAGMTYQVYLPIILREQ